MKIFCKKVNGVLAPLDDHDREALKKIRAGQIVQVEYKQPRNVQFHRKFFALMNLVFENQDRYEQFQYFLNEIKFRVGHADQQIIDGHVVFTPRSISFPAMDNTSFETFYSRAIDVVLAHFLQGMTAEDLDRYVQEIIGFA